MTSSRQDVVWQNGELARTFVANVRGGIPYAHDQIEIMLRMIRARGVAPATFADLGCGSGVLSHALLSEFAAARGTLIDFSEPMLEAAESALNEYSGQLRFVHADLASSQWAGSEKFDVVVSGFAIHHLAHARKRELFQEIFTSLNPNGMFINIEHVKSATPWLETQADELLIDSLFAYHTRTGSNKTRSQVSVEFVHRPDKVANILAPVEMQCAWLREIGFQDVDCFFKVFELAVFGGRKL